MRILVLDTSTTMATVAVLDGDRLQGEAARTVTTHSEGLLQLIDEVLATAKLSADALQGVICGTGPGSFTGIRIGVATAKGLSFATGVPLWGVISTLGLARRVAAAAPLTLTLVDAGRGEVFAVLYQGLDVVLGPWSATLAAVVERVVAQAAPRQVCVVGEGALRYAEQLLALAPRFLMAPTEAHALSAGQLGLAALELQLAEVATASQEVLPSYVREPDIWQHNPP